MQVFGFRLFPFRKWLGVGLCVVHGLCQAAAISCDSSAAYAPTQEWPFDTLTITPLFHTTCTGGIFSTCQRLPTFIGATAELQGNVIAVELYGSDTALPSSIPQPTVGSTITVGPLEDGVYRISVHVRNIDAQGNTTTCADMPYLLGNDNIRIHVPTGPVEKRLAVEFYNAARDHYFLTIDPKEIADLDEGVHPGWTRTGVTFFVFGPGKSGGTGVPVCRFYGRPEAGLDSHFYTADPAECAALPGKYNGAWQLETTNAFEVWPEDAPPPTYAPPGTPPSCNDHLQQLPLIRMWNQRIDSDHRYLADGNPLFTMLQKGWIEEGDMGCYFRVPNS